MTRPSADDRLLTALERTGLPDPRETYREWLRRLRERDAASYQAAVDYYQRTLLPQLQREESDVLSAWLEYGRFLAAQLVGGVAVQIDATGRSSPYQAPAPLDHLILHLPTSAREAALPISLPASPSAAQRATYELLVLRKTG